VSRNVNPHHAAVVSITQLHAGSAYNVIPDDAHLAGTIRGFSDEARRLMRDRLRAICAGIAATFDVEVEADVRDIFSVLVNSHEHADIVARVAGEVVGGENVSTAPSPKTGSEDFADMLQAKPGAYFWLGHKGTTPVHNPHFVFDDDILPVGASVFARLVETRLALSPDV
jgi:amidohydrolase